MAQTICDLMQFVEFDNPELYVPVEFTQLPLLKILWIRIDVHIYTSLVTCRERERVESLQWLSILADEVCYISNKELKILESIMSFACCWHRTLVYICRMDYSD